MIEGQEDVTWPQWLALARDVRAGRPRGALPLRPLHLGGRGRHRAGRSTPGRRSPASPPAPSGSAWGRWSRRRRSGTRRCSAGRRRRSTTSPAAGSSSASGPAGTSASTRAFGFPFPPLGERMEVFEEQAEVIVGQWTTESFSYAGRHYRLEDCDALPAPGAAPAPAADRRRLGPARARSRWPPAGAGVQRRRPRPSAECRALRSAAGRGLRAPRPRPGHARPLGDEHGGRRRSTRPRPSARAQRDGRPRLRAGRRRARCWPRTATRGCAARSRRRSRGCASCADAGVERMMLQHLLHDDLEAVELMGRELVPAVS